MESINNKRIAKNALYLYARTFIVLIISLYTSRVTLHALGETDYGIYNVVGGIVLLFAFLNTSMAAATQRFLNFEMGKGNIQYIHRIFNISVLAHISIAVVVFIAAETIGLWFFYTKLNIPDTRFDAACWVYQLSILCCCLQITRIPYNASVIAYERMSFYAYISIIETILKLCIAILISYSSGEKLVRYSILMFVVISITNVLYLIYCRKTFPQTCKFQLEWDRETYFKLMTFSGWSMVGSVSNVASNQGVSFIFNILGGVLLNTALGIVHQVTIAITSFFSSFQTAFNPPIVKNYASQSLSQFYSLLYRSSRFSFYFSLIIAIPLTLYCSPILTLWLGKVPEHTISFTKIMVWYCVLDSLSMPLWISVQASGKIKNYQLTMATLTILTIPFCYIIMKYVGWAEAALSVLVFKNFFLYLSRLIFAHKLVGLNLSKYTRQVLFRILPVTFCSVFSTILLKTNNENIFNSIIGIVTSLILTTSAIIFIGLTKKERKLLLQKAQLVIQKVNF